MFSIQQLLCHRTYSMAYNPFGGLDDAYLQEVLQAQIDLPDLAQKIMAESPQIIEFIGKKGRGKTTHLRALAQLLPPDKIIYYPKETTIVWPPKQPIMLIDSVHEHPFSVRFKLWTHPSLTLIVNDHFSRKLEYLFAQKSYRTFRFKGLNADTLKKTIQARIRVASNVPIDAIPLDDKLINSLLLKYKDDFRGILNYLYDAFQAERKT